MTRRDFIAHIRENVANNVRWYRYQIGLTQAELSERIGMSVNRVYLLENPKLGGVPLAVLASLAHELKIEIADLVAFREPLPAKHGLGAAMFLNHRQSQRQEKRHD